MTINSFDVKVFLYVLNLNIFIGQFYLLFYCHFKLCNNNYVTVYGSCYEIEDWFQVT